MNSESQKKISQYLTAAGEGKSFDLNDALDEAIRKHADGTPCKAQTPDSCPFNQKAEKGEDLSNAKPQQTPDIEKAWKEVDSLLDNFAENARYEFADASGGDGGSSWYEETVQQEEDVLRDMFDKRDWKGLDEFVSESGDDSTGPDLAYYGRLLEQAGELD